MILFVVRFAVYYYYYYYYGESHWRFVPFVMTIMITFSFVEQAKSTLFEGSHQDGRKVNERNSEWRLVCRYENRLWTSCKNSDKPKIYTIMKQ